MRSRSCLTSVWNSCVSALTCLSPSDDPSRSPISTTHLPFVPSRRGRHSRSPGRASRVGPSGLSLRLARPSPSTSRSLDTEGPSMPGCRAPQMGPACRVAPFEPCRRKFRQRVCTPSPLASPNLAASSGSRAWGEPVGPRAPRAGNLAPRHRSGARGERDASDAPRHERSRAPELQAERRVRYACERAVETRVASDAAAAPSTTPAWLPTSARRRCRTGHP